MIPNLFASAHRQSDNERCPSIFSATGRFDRTPVQTNDLTRNGEAEAQACGSASATWILLGKLVENEGQEFVFDSFPGIGHKAFHAVVVPANAQRNRSA